MPVGFPVLKGRVYVFRKDLTYMVVFALALLRWVSSAPWEYVPLQSHFASKKYSRTLDGGARSFSLSVLAAILTALLVRRRRMTNERLTA